MYHWWERNPAQPLWKTVWRVLRKLNLELPHDPAIPLLGVCPEKPKEGLEERFVQHVQSSIIHNRQRVEASQLCADERVSAMCNALTVERSRRSHRLRYG